MNLADPNRLLAAAEDDHLPRWKGLLLVLFTTDVDVLETLAANPANHPITDRLLAKHAEPSIRAAVARKAGLGLLRPDTIRTLSSDPDPHVKDTLQTSQAGDWNRDYPTEDDNHA